MGRSAYTNLSGAISQMTQVELIANNLANVATVGFKQQRLSLREAGLNFEEYLQQVAASGGQVDADTLSRLGAVRPNDAVIGVQISGAETDFRDGQLNTTDNPLDLALQGDGFFVVQTPEGERFTRAGNFSLNQNSELIDSNGNFVKGRGNKIVVTGNNISIDERGAISANGVEIDQLDLQTVSNKPDLAKLIRTGDSSWRYDGPATELTPATTVRVQQGFLEGSNVNETREMVQMINSARAFELYQRAITMESDLERMARQRLVT